jgi:hypothetical protein
MKKIKFIALIILVYCLFISCKSKQITKTINSIDTIKVEKIIKIQTPQLNSIKIESVCDSVGALKQFKYTFTSDKVKVSLKTIKDTLYLTYNVDSIVDSRLNEFKSSYKSEKEVVKEKVKNPLNLKLLIYAIIATIWIFRKSLLKLIKL